MNVEAEFESTIKSLKLKSSFPKNKTNRPGRSPSRSRDLDNNGNNRHRILGRFNNLQKIPAPLCQLCRKPKIPAHPHSEPHSGLFFESFREVQVKIPIIRFKNCRFTNFSGLAKIERQGDCQAHPPVHDLFYSIHQRGLFDFSNLFSD
jgi:hypothetical protein